MSIWTELRKVVLGSGNWFMMSPWFLGTSVFYDTVLIKERLNLMNKYHFSMHLSLILIKSFIINLQFYPFWRYYLKVSLIPGCCSQLVPENRHGFRKLVSRVSMFSQLCIVQNKVTLLYYQIWIENGYLVLLNMQILLFWFGTVLVLSIV